MDNMSKKHTLSEPSDVTMERKHARIESEYTDADKELDQQIKRICNRDELPLDKLEYLSFVLLCIVAHSPHLNQHYIYTHHCRELLQDDARLSRELEEAWQTGKFANIRRWAELSRLPTPDAVAVKAWTEEYCGDSASVLEKALNKMNTERPRDSVYATILPIVQSSGMGKSRTVDELAKSIFTLPFNLRPSEDTTGFPSADISVRTFFEPLGQENYDALLIRYLMFFTNLFQKTQVHLSMWDEKFLDARSLASKWRSTLESESFRGDHYKTVTDISSLKDHKTISSARNAALEAGLKLTSTIISMSSDNATHGPTTKICPVQIICYFDESHTLNKGCVIREGISGRTPYQILCACLDTLSDLNMFSIFLSTTISFSTPALPQSFFPSSRSIKATLTPIQPPFTELPFDIWQKDNKPAVVEGEMLLSEICHVSVMARFGRPLFWTRLIHDERDIKAKLLYQFAMEKLAGYCNFAEGPLRRNAALAALSVRLSLEFEPWRTSRIKESELVEANMRVIFSVPRHREFMWSGYPSEPILAEAAARLMEHCNIVETLVTETLNGLIQNGERGELVARTLLMQAHDKAIRAEAQGSHSTNYSSPLSLKAFFIALFGESATARIWDSTACNIIGSQTFGQEFKDAQVHFTHYIQASKEFSINDEAAFAAMCRGAAWQCPPQHGVDIGVPVLLWDKKLSCMSMTMLWFQIKDQRDKWDYIVDADTEEFFTDDIGDDKRPYIVVIMDLGVSGKHVQSQLTIAQPPIHASGPLTHSQHPKFQINLSGCTSDLYPVIEKSEEGAYCQLLESHTMLDEYTDERKDGVLRLKPFFTPQPTSNDWVLLKDRLT